MGFTNLSYREQAYLAMSSVLVLSGTVYVLLLLALLLSPHVWAVDPFSLETAVLFYVLFSAVFFTLAVYLYYYFRHRLDERFWKVVVRAPLVYLESSVGNKLHSFAFPILIGLLLLGGVPYFGITGHTSLSMGLAFLGSVFLALGGANLLVFYREYLTL